VLVEALRIFVLGIDNKGEDRRFGPCGARCGIENESRAKPLSCPSRCHGQAADQARERSVIGKLLAENV